VLVPKCILIVDDNASIRHILRRAFEETPGWEVCGEAANGLEAIEKAQELKPDLIVLDLSMPVMNGLQAAPVLRQMLPTVPIILFTLYDSKFLKREAFSAGITTVVSKDAAMETVVDQAEGLLRAARA
jgi:DNA-binding NarL/FixJ family response regulator